ncbi:hypothetical protein EG68_09446 [Paragonimus skrjabini miyazakii]|uniref:Uncharacterized protein n=1 Tax=Paragonimus skrjabini miyazakii TaxID=59628 RepID=A0A8S9YJY3_9TREM|nr:hypothetical protein EG68_09446 [Paragonimus skrjabini miyazakii]
MDRTPVIDGKESVFENLKTNAIRVNLMQPETMSTSELLELFQVRGMGRLVSKSDSVYRLVELYYDHLMPMKSRAASPTPVNLTNNPDESKVDVNTRSPAASHKDSQAIKRKPEVRLEDIIITTDPKWTTPGCGPSPTEERVLSVKQPNTLIKIGEKPPHSKCDSNEHFYLDRKGDGKHLFQTSNQQDSVTFGRKRTKLKRDFTALV